MVNFYSLEGPDFNGSGLVVQFFQMKETPIHSSCNPRKFQWHISVQALKTQLDGTISFRMIILVQMKH